MTIFGCDFSDYDWGRGSMNIQAMKNDGINFMTHKLTEQTSSGFVYLHENVFKFWDRALRADVPCIGCYVVVRSGIATATQVDTALRNTRQEWLDYPGFFWQVDTERWPYDAVPLSKGTEMAKLLEARTGKQAVHYASVGQYGHNWDQPYPRWNANYNPLWNPTTGICARYPYRTAYGVAKGNNGAGWVGSTKIWQYTDNGIVGNQVRVDCNAYKGTLEDFKIMIGAGTAPTPPVTVTSTHNNVWMG